MNLVLSLAAAKLIDYCVTYWLYDMRGESVLAWRDGSLSLLESVIMIGLYCVYMTIVIWYGCHIYSV